MEPKDVIEKIEFKQSKEFVVEIIRDKIAEKIAMQADDGSHFELGTKRVFVNPAMLVVIDVYDNYLEIGKKGMGDQLVGIASNILKQNLKKEENSGNPSPKQAGTTASAPATTESVSVEEKLRLVQLLKSIKELLDCGAITEEEYNEQKKAILNQISGVANNQPAPAQPEPEEPVKVAEEVASQPEPKPEPVEEPIEESVQDEPVVEEPVKDEPATKEEEVQKQPVEEVIAQPEQNPQEEVVEEEPIEEQPVEEAKEEVIDKEYCDKLAQEAKIVFNKERNFKKAYQMLLESSKGSQLGKYYLANFCYLKGWGTKKNVPEAKRLLQELADEGYQKAIKALEDL